MIARVYGLTPNRQKGEEQTVLWFGRPANA